MPNVLSPRDLVFRPDNMDKTVPHTSQWIKKCRQGQLTWRMLIECVKDNHYARFHTREMHFSSRLDIKF